MFLLFFGHGHCSGWNGDSDGGERDEAASHCRIAPEPRIARAAQPVQIDWRMTGGYAQLQLRDYPGAMVYSGETAAGI